MRTRDTTDGFALAFDRSGSGSPVLLLHGWPGDRTDFAEVVAVLEDARGADLIRPDLRGFGVSDKHPGGDYSAAAQVRSIIGLLDELRVERAVLGGYDVGSRLAQLVATTHPERVESMVLAPPFPSIGRRVFEPSAIVEFWYQCFHQLDLATELLDGRPDPVRAYLRHFWNHWSGPGSVVSEGRLEHLTRQYAPSGAFAASIGWYRSGAAAVTRSLAETLPERRIAARTTALWPECDPLFPPGVGGPSGGVVLGRDHVCPGRGGALRTGQGAGDVRGGDPRRHEPLTRQAPPGRWTNSTRPPQGSQQ